MKDVFDSGLRPMRWDSSLVSECLVEDRLIRFEITNNYAVTLYASYCYFDLNVNGDLQSIKAESPYLTLDEARKWMLPIVEIFSKSREDLDSYLKLVSSGDREREDQMRWNKGSSAFEMGTPQPPAQSDLPSMGVSLRWRWNKDLPTQILLLIEWRRPYKSMHSPNVPPSAPPGYEQFPIVTKPFVPEFRRNKGDRLPAWLNSSVIPKAQPVPQKDGSLVPPQRTMNSKASPASETSQKQASESNIWIWLVLALTGILVAMYVVCRGHKTFCHL